jgi:hypothetical protein
VIGVWDNGNRDRSARAEAEADRIAAAQEAEAIRAAEVVKDQAAADAAQRIRVAELVQPKYEQLLADLHHTMNVVEDCEDALNTYLRQFGLPPLLGTTSDLSEWDLPVKDTSGLGTIAIRVDDTVIAACSEIKPSVDPLELSLDQARLVSVPSLRSAADDLGAALQTGLDGADELLGRIDESGTIELLDDGTGGYLPDGTPLIRSVIGLNRSLSGVTVSSQELIEQARGVVLEVEP